MAEKLSEEIKEAAIHATTAGDLLNLPLPEWFEAAKALEAENQKLREQIRDFPMTTSPTEPAE